MIQKLILSRELSAPIGAYRIAKFSDPANSSKVAPATAATDSLTGTTGQLGGDTGDMVDLDLAGIGQVQLGGTVRAGKPITADANAKGIEATVDGQRIIGWAQQPGIADDIIDYLCAPAALSVGA